MLVLAVTLNSLNGACPPCSQQAVEVRNRSPRTCAGGLKGATPLNIAATERATNCFHVCTHPSPKRTSSTEGTE